MRLSRDGPIALVAIGAARGPVRLTAAVHSGLCRVSEEIDLDDEVRVVVLESRGAAFCLGDGSDAPRPGSPGDGVAAVAALRVPVIALLCGDAVDAGLELALACDLRLATPAARLGLTQVARGELPIRGGSQRLARVVGRASALRMLLLAELVRGRAARDLGLLHEVVSARGLPVAGRRLATRLAERAPIAQRLAKEALAAAFDLPLAEGLRLEGDLYVLLQSTRDRDEGIASFRERRSPVFTGR